MPCAGTQRALCLSLSAHLHISLSAARMLAGSGRRLFPTVVPAAIGSSQACLGEVVPRGEDAGEGHSHLSPAQCCSRLRSQGRADLPKAAFMPRGLREKTHPKASGFLLINTAHNIIRFSVLPTLTIL